MVLLDFRFGIAGKNLPDAEIIPLLEVEVEHCFGVFPRIEVSIVGLLDVFIGVMYSKCRREKQRLLPIDLTVRADCLVVYVEVETDDNGIDDMRAQRNRWIILA
ncbi:hypothetical protein BRC88_03790 [Halobacteriales archaeon QS_4_69_225]|nr:MAG: hypothetical protein BRC88_03790 [Halobacteriales archaeon QS_4_69_225]